MEKTVIEDNRLDNVSGGTGGDKGQIAAKVIDIISRNRKTRYTDSILHKTWAELGVDSMTFVEIVMDIEDEFSIYFEDREMNEFKTVNDLVNAVFIK